MGYESKVNLMRKFWNPSGLDCAAALSHTYKTPSLIKYMLVYLLMSVYCWKLEDKERIINDSGMMGQTFFSYVTL